MSLDQIELLSLRQLPARLTVDQAAWYLGFGSYEMAALIASKLLKPLGHPVQNGHKYFATCELERLRNDDKWLHKASDAVTRYKRQRNQEERIRREARDLDRKCAA